MVLDSQYVWVTTKRGLVQRSKTDMSICAIWNSSNSVIDDFPLYNPTIDPYGNFWCTSPKKVFRYDGQDWASIDTVSNSGVGFNQDGTPEYASFFYTRAGSGGLVLIGHTEIKNDFQGNIWKANTDYWCGGQGASFQSCNHYVSDISKKNQSGGWGTQATFNATTNLNVPLVVLDNFAIDPDGAFWYQSQGNLIERVGSLITEHPIDMGISFDSLFFASDSTFYLVKKATSMDTAAVYIFENDEFIYDSLLSTLEAFSFEVDENGDLFGWDENSVWKIDSTGILNRYESPGLYSQDIKNYYFNNNGVWLEHENGIFSKIDSNMIALVDTNNVIPSDQIIRYFYADKMGNIWGFLNYVFFGTPTLESHLFKFGDTIEAIDTASCGLLSYSIADFHSDTSGNVWFVYRDTVEGMVVCQFDGVDWINYDNMDVLYNSSAIPEGMRFIHDNLVKKNSTGLIEVFPFPDTLSVFSGATKTAISETGIAWKFIRESDFSDLWQRFVFDGQEWKQIPSFSITSYYEHVSEIFAVDSGVYVLVTPSPFGINYQWNLKPQLRYHHFDGTSGVYNIPYSCDNNPYNKYYANPKGYARRNGNLLLSYGAGQFATPYGYCGEYEKIIELQADSVIASWDVDYRIHQTENGTIWLSNKNDLSLIKEYEPIVQFFEKNIEICEGANVFGTVLSGYLGLVNFDWEDGQSTFQRYLPNGIYEVSLTSNNGFTFVESYEMNAPPLTGSVQIDSSTNFSILQSIPFGGTAPYSFLWNTGAETDTIQTTLSGDYSVTITDANNCEYINTYNLFIPNYTNDIELHVYPNPAYDQILFQYTTAKNGDFRVSISDGKGVEHFTEIQNTNAGVYQIEVDVSRYAAGIYFFHIHYGAVIRHTKFVIMKN